MFLFGIATKGSNISVLQLPTTDIRFKVWIAIDSITNICTVTLINKNRGGDSIPVKINLPAGLNVARMVTMESPGGLDSKTSILVGNIDFDGKVGKRDYREMLLPVVGGSASILVPFATAMVVRLTFADEGSMVDQTIFQKANTFSAACSISGLLNIVFVFVVCLSTL